MFGNSWSLTRKDFSTKVSEQNLPSPSRKDWMIVQQVDKIYLFNPNISMYILHTDLYLMIGSLSKDVCKTRESTGSQAISLFIKFVLPSVFTLIEKICPKIWAKKLPNNAGSLVPVDVRRSKTPNNF